MTRRPARALTGLVLSCVMVSLLSVIPAGAATGAQASQATAGSSGRWAAVVRGTTSSATSGTLPLAFSWTSGTRNQTTYQRLDLANVGTLNITGALVTIPKGTTAANWSSTGTPSAVINLRLCNGGSWTVGGTGNTSATCSSGSVTTVRTTGGATSCSNLATACAFAVTSTSTPGQERALVMGMTSGRAGTYSVTVGAEVNRSRVRAAIVRNA